MRTGQRSSIVCILLCSAVLCFGAQPAAAGTNSCAGDLNGDDAVTIDELVAAVNSALSGCAYNPVIDPPTSSPASPIYFPLEPGTTFHYASQSEDIDVTVTHDTKVILGVTCTVVHDVVTEDGETTEDTFDWYAQDRDGNVWYFGEDTRAFDNGHVSTEGSWEAGVDGAKPGIAVEGQPQVGDAYRQEYYAGVAEDRGEGEALECAQGPGFRRYREDARRVFRAEPNVVEHKVFCPGIGQVLTLTVQGGNDREELLSISHE